jgi:hypothetical protein
LGYAGFETTVVHLPIINLPITFVIVYVFGYEEVVQEAEDDASLK